MTPLLVSWVFVDFEFNSKIENLSALSALTVEAVVVGINRWVCSCLTFFFLPFQMFQVVHNEKPLYVQAGNCVEASEWLEILGQVSRCNEGRLATFHASNYTNGTWQCCRSQSTSAPGCKPCTTWVLLLLQHHRHLVPTVLNRAQLVLRTHFRRSAEVVKCK